MGSFKAAVYGMELSHTVSANFSYPMNILLVFSSGINSQYKIDTEYSQNSGQSDRIFRQISAKYFVEVDRVWRHKHATYERIQPALELVTLKNIMIKNREEGKKNYRQITNTLTGLTRLTWINNSILAWYKSPVCCLHISRAWHRFLVFLAKLSFVAKLRTGYMFSRA